MPKTRPWSEIRAKIDADPARRARVDEGVRALRDGLALVDLRASLGLPEYDRDEDDDDSDVDAAASEHEEEIYVADLRGFVKAMGGRLEINAVFSDGTMTLAPSRRWIVTDSGDERQPGSGTARDSGSESDSGQDPVLVGAVMPSRRTE